MTEKIRRIIDWGLASDNKNKIIKFLDELNSIPFSDSKRWEKRLFDFFSEITIVHYIIETSLDEETPTREFIKKSFFSGIMDETTTFLSTDTIYKDLINIRESLKNGKKLKDYLEFLFKINHHIKHMMVKKIDHEDKRWKEFGVGITPVCLEFTPKENSKFYEITHFILPDKDIDYPLKEWHKKISQYWRKKWKDKLNDKEKKIQKRNPIESRLRHEVFKRDNYKCIECGKDNKNSTLHVDHIIPISQSGNDELENLQTLCQACNLAKSNRKWERGIKNE